MFWLESANALCSLYNKEFLGFISAKPRKRVNSQLGYSSKTILSHIRRRETERDREYGQVVRLHFHMTWRLQWHCCRATWQKIRTLFPLSWAAEIEIAKGTDRATAYRHYRKPVCFSAWFSGTIISCLHSYVEIFPRRWSKLQTLNLGIIYKETEPITDLKSISFQWTLDASIHSSPHLSVIILSLS